MEIPCDTSFWLKFEALSHTEFWIYIKKELLEPSQLAIEVLLLLAMTHL
jgi:hypothetical protein